MGCIVLKPLQDAIDAGDAIRAVIWNTGVNQDGRTRGITMPNSASQEELIRTVYRQAQIDPIDTGYVEAHGTGTTVGDPAEARALSAVFCKGKNRKSPLFIGSVKSNVGHAEGASGIVAVIKTALMLERGFILPNCGVTEPNDEIPMKEWNMKVNTLNLPSCIRDVNFFSSFLIRFPKRLLLGREEKNMPVSITSGMEAPTLTLSWANPR